MDCPECNRLRRAYVDASKRSIDFGYVGYVPKDVARSRDQYAEVAADLEAQWMTARDAFHEHLKIHQKERAGSAETE